MADIFTRAPLDKNNELTTGNLKGRFGEDFFDSIFFGKKIKFTKPR
jgi:hypothetical protein